MKADRLRHMRALASEIRDLLVGCGEACPEGPEHTGMLVQLADELLEHIEDEKREQEPEEDGTDPSQVRLPCSDE